MGGGGVKIVMHGPLAGPGPHGAMEGWGPNQVIEIDDQDQTAVAWAEGWLEMGATPYVEPPPPEPVPTVSEPTPRRTRKGPDHA
jgi:hypothetical protein